jgi:hypothetical protein
MPRRLRPLGFSLVACVLAAAALAACSQSGGTAPLDAEDAGSDAESLALRVEPAQSAVEIGLDGAAPPLAFRAFAKEPGQAEVEVTNAVSWSLQNPALADIDAKGNATLEGPGGKTQVLAGYKGQIAGAALTITLRGAVFSPGTDASTAQAFDSAQVDPDPQSAPALEYPEDGVVLPANLPPIEAQWAQGGDSSIYRVSLAIPDTLDLAFYTTSRELAFPPDVWAKVRATAPDIALALKVDGLGASGMLHAGSPRAVTVASDGIDESAIYVWQSSSGSFRVLDIVKGTDVPLPTNSPALAPGQPCSGCHRISRDGRRFSYTFNGGEFNFGSLVYDAESKVFASKINPAPSLRGTYAAFNPREAQSRPAMLLTAPDSVPQNTPGTVRLLLLDPETAAPVPNNFAETVKQIDPALGQATMMPDWSPGGDFVVFTAFNSDKNYVRLLGDDVVLGSIVEAPVSYSAADQSFQFGAPKVLVPAPAGADPDTGENNLLPSISPDGAVVAFTRANGWWSIKTQQSLINLSGRIALVRRKDGTVLTLERGASNGPDKVWSSTWPQWAPTFGQRYAWLAYASERPYGHRLTPQNSTCSLVQGQKQCKQLWVTALDLDKLIQGQDDPSHPAFWIPGQSTTAQYVSPQWTTAVLPPPK